MTRASYRETFRQSEKTLAKRVSAYLARADEKNVHDLRTSMRRVLAGIDLLPGRLRNGRKIAKYDASLEKLMKANAKTRDLDIVSSKIARKNSTGQYNDLLKKLGRLRESSIRAGLARARALRVAPRVPLRRRGASGSGLERRFEKLSNKYAARIIDRLPRVITDPDERDELHKLREDARRLRYTLELGEKKSAKKQLKILRSWQDVLGDVHDSDIFIQYFEGSENSDEKSLVEDELVVRNRNYEKFRSLAGEPIDLES